jgi:hypothetical protein
MKKILSLILPLLVLTGCGLTNQEIIEQTKQCEEAGFYAEEINTGLGIDIGKIQCTKYLPDYNMDCPPKNKKVVDIKIECNDGYSGCTDIYTFEDGSVCKI